jgi:hypothetical protein
VGTEQEVNRIAASLRSISRSLDRLVALEFAKASGDEDAVREVVLRMSGKEDRST